jgi:hypothetical protein
MICAWPILWCSLVRPGGVLGFLSRLTAFKRWRVRNVMLLPIIISEKFQKIMIYSMADFQSDCQEQADFLLFIFALII